MSPKQLMSEDEIRRALTRVAHEIVKTQWSTPEGTLPVELSGRLCSFAYPFLSCEFV